MHKVSCFLPALLFSFVTPAQKINKDGFRVTNNHCKISVTFITDEIIRIQKTPEGSNDIRENPVIRDLPYLHSHIAVQNKDNEVIASGSSLKVIYNQTTNSFRFISLKKGSLAAELPNTASFTATSDDGIPSFTTSQAFRFDSTEAIYGFGQHQNGKFNQRHETILLRQRNMAIAIPFFQSSKSYGIYWENGSLTKYEPQADGGKLTSEIGSSIDYYFIAGNDPNEVVKGFRDMTGKVPMLPLWSFGYIQSKERYRTQYELVDVVQKYRALQVPLDAVVQDWQYWGNDNLYWNAVDFLNKGFPDPQSAIDSIHNMHAKVMISVWPSFGSKTSIYQELDKKNLLLNFPTYPVNDSVKVYDAFHPEARKIYWDYMNKNIFRKGIDAWWLDATEPIQKDVLKNTNKTAEHELVFKDKLTSVDSVKTYLGSFKSNANVFPYASVKAVYEGQRHTTSNKRVFILTRSAFAGQQRTGSVLWSGDITASWEVLKAQIPAALNLSLSGMPYWNADIGGFYSKNYPGGLNNLLYQELYLRWMQFAVFTAMMRSHGTNAPREIFQLGKKGDLAFDVADKYIRLRYTLQPYIYSTSWQVSNKNASLMRPLVMDYPADEKVKDNANSYLFGQSILVSPVTDSIFTKANTSLNDTSTITKNIYLPNGEWFNFWNSTKIQGGRMLNQQLTLSQIPVFIKAGSIVPIAEVPQYSSIQNFKNLTINVYPGKDAKFTLYEDEGDNYNYEKNKFSLIEFQWNNQRRSLTIQSRKGAFNGMETSRRFTVHVADSNKTKDIVYSGDRIDVQF